MKGKIKTRESSAEFDADGHQDSGEGRVSPDNSRSNPGDQERNRQLEEKIGALVNSFEERIRKLRTHVSELENRISELRAAKDQARAAFDEFLSVQELSEMLRTTQDPFRVVEALKLLLHKFFEFDSLSVFLFNELKGGLEPLGRVSQELSRAARSQYEEGIIDWIFSERRPVAIPWMESFGEEPPQPGKNLVISPMIVGDRPLGIVLLSTSRRHDDFTSQDLKMLYFAVSHAAVAIQNAMRTREITSNKDFLANLLENAGDVIFSLDKSGKFNYVNPKIEDLGFLKEDLLGQHYRKIFRLTETAERVNNTLTFGNKQVFDIELRTQPRGFMRRFTVNLVPLKGEKAENIGALGIMRDVTEINRLQIKLLESERLAAYTQTVITLNHEINNPLTAVLGNAYLLEKYGDKIKDEKLRRRLSVIQENCLRIQQVIKKLEKIEELKTVSYLGETKMLDLGDQEKEATSPSTDKE